LLLILNCYFKVEVRYSEMSVLCDNRMFLVRILGLERYWHSVIGYWAIFADIG